MVPSAIFSSSDSLLEIYLVVALELCFCGISSLLHDVAFGFPLVEFSMEIYFTCFKP